MFSKIYFLGFIIILQGCVYTQPKYYTSRIIDPAPKEDQNTFEDENIKAKFQNTKTNKDITLIWNDVRYIRYWETAAEYYRGRKQGERVRPTEYSISHKGSDSDKEKKDTVRPSSIIHRLAYYDDYIRYYDNLKAPLYKTGFDIGTKDEYVHERYAIRMPMLINNERKDYEFLFEITGYENWKNPPSFPKEEYIDGKKIEPMKE
jgi:hypothetical protein